MLFSASLGGVLAMPRRTVSATARLGSLVSLLLFVSAAGQPAEKVRLQFASAVGDRRVAEASMEMEIDIQGAAGERELPAFTIGSRFNEKFTEEVLSVDARGRPSGIRRAYSVSRRSDTAPTGETKDRVTSLQGKMVAVRRSGGKVTVTSTGGKLVPEDHNRLLAALEHPDQELLPDRDVGLGDTWEVQRKLAPTLFGGGSSRMGAKFEEIVEHAGHRAARLAAALEMKGQPKGSPGPITVTLEGNLYHALDLRRPLSADLAGPVILTAAKTEKGVRYTLKGDGAMRVRETYRWLRIDGKAVPAAAGPGGAQAAPSPAPGLGGG